MLLSEKLPWRMMLRGTSLKLFAPSPFQMPPSPERGLGRGRGAENFRDVLRSIVLQGRFLDRGHFRSFFVAQKGAKDNRGKPVVAAVLRAIEAAEPRMFLLENVPGLVEDHKPFFDWIIKRLSELRSNRYEVIWDFMDTKDHGVAQSRKRVIILGFDKRHYDGNFRWPQTAMYQLQNYLTLVEKIKQKGGKVGLTSQPWVGDLQASKSFGPNLAFGYVPCITSSRAKGGGFYLFSHGRWHGNFVCLSNQRGRIFSRKAPTPSPRRHLSKKVHTFADSPSAKSGKCKFCRPQP